jgi:hypothetical protein
MRGGREGGRQEEILTKYLKDSGEFPRNEQL